MRGANLRLASGAALATLAALPAGTLTVSGARASVALSARVRPLSAE